MSSNVNVEVVSSVQITLDEKTAAKLQGVLSVAVNWDKETWASELVEQLDNNIGESAPAFNYDEDEGFFVREDRNGDDEGDDE